MNPFDKIYRAMIADPQKYKCIDIYQHLPTLIDLVKSIPDCRVTEFGVRWGASSVAFLSASPKTLLSYDILKTNESRKLEIFAKACEIEWDFRIGDTLKIDPIPETDILFIDTLHTYGQLKQELAIHGNRAQKHIVFHDTTSFGHKDERVYDFASDAVKNKTFDKVGIAPAIDEFLAENDGLWKIGEIYTNNNGLTVITRKS